MEATKKTRSQSSKVASAAPGVGQLSLVEHSLCPLDTRASLQPGLRHASTFQYSDAKRRRRTAHVEISCPHGLSAHDEYYLWGLLALALSQPTLDNEFHATPHYCLRQLGLIDVRSRRGGRQYQQFSAAVERLSWVKYGCDAFYDPIRAEHCVVRFGFFSYRSPHDSDSNRAWRFYWDSQFFELVKAVGGSLRFDLGLYRRLSPGARRLFLFVSKVFSRSAQTPRMQLRQLAVDILGLSPKLLTKHLLAKLRRICAELATTGVIMELHSDNIRKVGKGNYTVMLCRGRGQAKSANPAHAMESPLVEPLRLIGLDEDTVTRTLRKYPCTLLREWADITLAAKERFGSGFFKRSPVAYFLDNVKKSSEEGRTPPDWWLDIRKAEERRQGHSDRKRSAVVQRQASSDTGGRELFDRIRGELFSQLQSSGLDEQSALAEANRQARDRVAAYSNGTRPKLTSAKAVLSSLPIKFP